MVESRGDSRGRLFTVQKIERKTTLQNSLYYTSTDQGGGTFDDILRRIQAGISGVLNTGPGAGAVTPPAYTPVATAGANSNNLLLIGVVILAVYLMTR